MLSFWNALCCGDSGLSFVSRGVQCFSHQYMDTPLHADGLGVDTIVSGLSVSPNTLGHSDSDELDSAIWEIYVENSPDVFPDSVMLAASDSFSRSSYDPTGPLLSSWGSANAMI